MNSDTTGNEKIISELKEMEKDIEEIRKVMEKISKKGDCISLLKIHSQYISSYFRLYTSINNCFRRYGFIQYQFN